MALSSSLLSSDRMDWATPDALFRALDGEFAFTLDAAASSQNTKCPAFFDEEANGLERNWADAAKGGCVWVNPPYGRAIGQWVAKGWEEYTRGARVVMLVPARPDTRWWSVATRAPQVRFIRGRVRFVGADAPAPFPSALVVFDLAYHRPCYDWMDSP